jgi:hypothetical protein
VVPIIYLPPTFQCISQNDGRLFTLLIKDPHLVDKLCRTLALVVIFVNKLLDSMDQYKELVARKYLLAQLFCFFLPKVQKWDCALELRGLP